MSSDIKILNLSPKIKKEFWIWRWWKSSCQPFKKIVKEKVAHEPTCTLLKSLTEYFADKAKGSEQKVETPKPAM